MKRLAPTPTNWQQAAALYLWIWLTIDRFVVNDFEYHGATCETLSWLFGRYGVHRTIPGTGKDRLRKFADRLNRDRNRGPEQTEFGALVSNATSFLEKSVGKRPLSAVSKAYWMMFGHPIAIYDGLTTAGLRALGYKFHLGDYGSYHEAWTRFFNSPGTQTGIDKACKWLPHSKFAREMIGRNAADLKEIDGWTKAAWFRNRVADQALWLFGMPNTVIDIPSHEFRRLSERAVSGLTPNKKRRH
jgi:hypothetical protein